ncbi:MULTISPECIES: VWA domain-containing protein [unclassified Variovorax]|uniref:vWA domain-containing protein n=1 Tax=unclassified Variovorax TaxID=663243 RepID=UPI0008B88C58|nr:MULTISPECIES: VWA domain-containing protein [unclassified Variovorax]SEJ08646.1 Ca-activated chloride channel family protein [Variovorax sp. OK202]SFB98163.1 Ca-activated chloride channel family protein [Variovorax sp. OK212]
MSLRVLSRRLALAVLAALSLGLAACGKDDVQAAAGNGAAPAADTAAFTILAGSELKDLEGPIVDAAKAAGVDVKFSYAGTLDIVERINAGERFDAILPPNGAYPALALQAKPLARDKLFYSRIALGVKSAKAAQLGWTRRPPGWAEIAKAAGAGQLRYGMTNATSSNTGMSALFAVASALAGKTEDLGEQDVDEKTLKAFLSGQKLTAGSSGWLADAYVKDPSAIDAMVNYEAVILRANEKLPKADQLTLIYPRDGMISADYPLMLLNANKREAYTQLVSTLKAAPFQRDALSAAFLRPANPEVAAAAALPTAAVAELGFPNRLEVIDAVLGTYQSQWRKPATSIFVLDLSGSMSGKRLASMREALKLLSGADAASTSTATASARYSAFQSRERVVLITFATQVQAPVWVRFDADHIEAARSELRQQADAMKADGGTAIYSALAAAEDLARQEQQREPNRFVSIVLLTDGENNSGLKPQEFRDRYAAGGLPARIFPILFGEANVSEMQQIAQLSGGREFDGRKLQLGQVFKEIRGYQ